MVISQILTFDFITHLELGNNMAQNQLIRTLAQVSTTVALVAGILMVLSVGIGDALNVIASPDDVDPQTVIDVFDGNINMVDRLAVAGVAVSVLVGLGAIGLSRSNPEVINALIAYMPLIIGVLGVTTFATEVGDIISGDFDFDAVTDGKATYLTFIAFSTVSAVLALIGMRNE